MQKETTITLNKTDIEILMAVDGETEWIKRRTKRHDKSIAKLVMSGILTIGKDYCLYLVSLKGISIAPHARA